MYFKSSFYKVKIYAANWVDKISIWQESYSYYIMSNVFHEKKVLNFGISSWIKLKKTSN